MSQPEVPKIPDTADQLIDQIDQAKAEEASRVSQSGARQIGSTLLEQLESDSSSIVDPAKKEWNEARRAERRSAWFGLRSPDHSKTIAAHNAADQYFKAHREVMDRGEERLKNN